MSATPEPTAQQWRQRALQRVDAGDPQGALAVFESAALALESGQRAQLRGWAVDAGVLMAHATGRPFADAPLVPDFGPAAAVPGGRAQPSPDNGQFILRTRDGWRVAHQEVCDPGAPFAPSESPATWLDEDTVAHGRKNTVILSDRHGDNEQELATFRRRVSSLLGPVPGDRPRLAVSTGGGEPTSPDFYFVDLEGQTRFVRHLVLDLVHDTARWSAGLICVGTGVQSSEVRLVWANDGRWQTRTIHQHPLRVTVECGDNRVGTVDSSGQMLFWEGDPPRPCQSAQLSDLSPTLTTPPCSSLYEPHTETFLLHQPTNMGTTGPAPLEHEQQPAPHRAAGPVLLARQIASGQMLTRGDIVGLPSRPAPNGVAPFLHRDGWIWLDCGTLEMPTEWKLSPGLAAEDSLRSHPWLRPHEVDAILYWRDSGPAETRPWPEHLAETGWFMRRSAGTNTAEP